MSRRNKLQKFEELRRLPNVFQNFDPQQAQLIGEHGRLIPADSPWYTDFFGNDHLITLELACGRGEYTLALAERFPNRNFIGVDVKGARIWKGATRAYAEEIRNVAFLRIRIEQLAYYFQKDAIDEIWITFPDPFPRKSKANRRLTSPAFLDRYRRVLRPSGLLHLKTDADSLYEYTIEHLQSDPNVSIIYANNDIYASALSYNELTIKTFYELSHLESGKTIKYIRFTI